MKNRNRLGHVPARTPFQDYQATQRRNVWIERGFKFAVCLVLLLIGLGRIGT